jgi:hypothetical protein
VRRRQSSPNFVSCRYGGADDFKPTEHWVKTICAVALLLAAVPVLGHEQKVILQASELVPWCRAQAEARYIAKSITPYQWTASYHDSGNMLFVEGKLRVHGDDVPVRCRIASGAREEFGTIQIDDSSL